MKTLLGIGVFLSVLFFILASENEQTTKPYKYALSKVDVIQAFGEEWWVNVIKPREWPFDTFIIISDSLNKNPLDMLPVQFWIVYKGNDTNRPQLSQIRIQPGENIHTLMETFCDEAGFVDADSLACRGVELTGQVSEVIYGRCYTTTRPSASMDDFLATRTTVITWLIHRYGYRRYLEIGCDQGITFAAIQVTDLTYPELSFPILSELN